MFAVVMRFAVLMAVLTGIYIALGWYMAKTMSANGVQQYDAFAHYLAYHEGHTGYRRGDWQKKDWLRQAATRVADQAVRYRGQYHRCS